MIFLIEFALIVGAIYLAVSQIIIPAVNGRKWFPVFRTEAELISEYTEVTQAEYNQTLQNEIKTKRKNLNNTKGKKNA